MSTHSRPLPLDPPAALMALRVQDLLAMAAPGRLAGYDARTRLSRHVGTRLSHVAGTALVRLVGAQLTTIRRTPRRPAPAGPVAQPCGC